MIEPINYRHCPARMRMKPKCIIISILFVTLVSTSCKNEDAGPIQGFVPSVVSFPEGDIRASFPLSFTSIGGKPSVLVRYELLEGTARFGDDLDEVSENFEIIDGKGIVHIPVVGDEYLELMETFSMKLTLEDREFLYDFIIIDDDEPAIILSDSDGFYTPETYPSMSLIWRDEFNSDSLDERYWSYETGDGCDKGICGWGNNELQIYTKNKENVRVEGGYLIIEANESFGSYRSARIITQGKAGHRFGRVDVRAKLPKGQGIWPAIWMLGSNIDAVGWPVCGEIDIMEMVGHQPEVTHGTVHYDNGSGYASSTGSRSIQGGDLSERFHVFSIVWDRDEIAWYLDYEKFKTFSKRSGETYPFNSEFFFILNVAVGGNWPGSPDEKTKFPAQMVVDYIRVFS